MLQAFLQDAAVTCCQSLQRIVVQRRSGYRSTPSSKSTTAAGLYNSRPNRSRHRRDPLDLRRRGHDTVPIGEPIGAPAHPCAGCRPVTRAGRGCR